MNLAVGEACSYVSYHPTNHVFEVFKPFVLDVLRKLAAAKRKARAGPQHSPANRTTTADGDQVRP